MGLVVTYEEIVARAIHERVLLQEHLNRVLTPFEQEPAICWICTRDMWGYICSEAYGDVRASVSSDYSFFQDTIDIRYRGLPVHIRENASASDEDKLFPAIVSQYIEQGFIDRLLPGMRILRNTSIFEKWIGNYYRMGAGWKSKLCVGRLHLCSRSSHSMASR